MNIKCTSAFEIAYIAVKNIYQSCEFAEEFDDKLTQAQKDMIGERIGVIEDEAVRLYWYVQRLKRVVVAENATTTSENGNG